MKDPRIDAYIEKAQPFAQPILKKLRTFIHKACPKVTETIKWGMPAFEYQGPLCSFAAFKHHAVFGFWKTTLLRDPNGYLQKHKAQGGEAMGNLGRITSVQELPPGDAMIDLITQAMRLNEAGIKVEKKKPAVKKAIPVPAEFQALLNKNLKVKSAFENFAPSHKREYLEWITEAKLEETRLRRMKKAIEWIREGKQRNWKYTK